MQKIDNEAAQNIINQLIYYNQHSTLNHFLTYNNIDYMDKINGEYFSSILLKQNEEYQNKAYTKLTKDINKNYYAFLKRQLESDKQEKLTVNQWSCLIHDFISDSVSSTQSSQLITTACLNYKQNFLMAYQNFVKRGQIKLGYNQNVFHYISIYCNPLELNETLQSRLLENSLSQDLNRANCLNYAISSFNYDMTCFILDNKTSAIVEQLKNSSINLDSQYNLLQNFSIFIESNLINKVNKQFKDSKQSTYDINFYSKGFIDCNDDEQDKDQNNNKKRDPMINPLIASLDHLMVFLEMTLNNSGKELKKQHNYYTKQQKYIFRKLQSFYLKNKLNLRTQNNENLLHIVMSFKCYSNKHKSMQKQYQFIMDQCLRQHKELINEKNNDGQSCGFMIKKSNMVLSEILLSYDNLDLEKKDNNNQKMIDCIKQKFKKNKKNDPFLNMVDNKLLKQTTVNNHFNKKTANIL